MLDAIVTVMAKMTISDGARPEPDDIGQRDPQTENGDGDPEQFLHAPHQPG